MDRVNCSYDRMTTRKNLEMQFDDFLWLRKALSFASEW